MYARSLVEISLDREIRSKDRTRKKTFENYKNVLTVFMGSLFDNERVKKKHGIESVHETSL